MCKQNRVSELAQQVGAVDMKQLKELVHNEMDALLKDERGEWVDGINWYEGYAEPGYSSDNEKEPGIDTGILVANWNNYEELGNKLEALGIPMEWEDEWVKCDFCYKLVRTEPNSYDWRPYYVIYETGDIDCLACLRKERCERVVNGWIVNIDDCHGGKQYVVVGDETKDEHGRDALDIWLDEFANKQYHPHGWR